MLLLDEMDRLPLEMREAVMELCRRYLPEDERISSLLNDFGPPPKTKSEIVRDWAMAAGIKIVERHCSPMDPKDLQGLPEDQGADKEKKYVISYFDKKGVKRYYSHTPGLSDPTDISLATIYDEEGKKKAEQHLIESNQGEHTWEEISADNKKKRG